MSKIRKKWLKNSTNLSRNLWSSSNHYSLNKRKMKLRMSKCSNSWSTSKQSKINWKHSSNGQLLNMLSLLHLRCSTQSRNIFRNQAKPSNLQIQVFLQLPTRWARSRTHLLVFFLKIQTRFNLSLQSLKQVLRRKKMDLCHAQKNLLRSFQRTIQLKITLFLLNHHCLNTQSRSTIIAKRYMMKTLM